MIYDWLSIEQLEKKVEDLRERAHDANGQNYAARAQDWKVASDVLERRKAEQM